MIGQYTNSEFLQIYASAGMFDKSFDPIEKRASICKGSTINYYIQHSDGSWTNYDCNTRYYP